MTNRDFAAWCKAATAKIRYGPDREAVREELQAHLEDKYDALVASGLSPEEAAVKTLESMGSPAEIAPQLGAIHRPWLGYLYTTLKVTAILSVLLSAFLLVVQGYTLVSRQYWANQFDSLIANEKNITYFERPELTANVEGYHIRIEEIAVTAEDRFCFLMEVSQWPWMQELKAWEELWAVDSLGNYYYPDSAGAYDAPRVSEYGYSGAGGVIHSYHMVILSFDTDAEWVELRYDRDGRDVVFHIDLTGGGNHE